MNIAGSVKKIQKSIGIFEILIGIMLLAFGVFAQSFLFSKGDTVYVRIRVVDRDIQYIDEGMPLSRIADTYVTGLQSKDGLGRVTAEIVKVMGFDRKYNTETFTEKEDVYITMKLRATYSQRSNGYKYQGMTIATGEWLNVSFGSITVHGFILDVAPKLSERPQETIIVHTLYQSRSDDNGEMDQHLADAVSVGNTVTDVSGNTIAEVLEKQVTPTRLMTLDQYGTTHQTYHTIKKDIRLTLKIRTEKRNGEYVYQDTIAIKTGAILPLFFPNLILPSKITAISDAK